MKESWTPLSHQEKQRALSTKSIRKSLKVWPAEVTDWWLLWATQMEGDGSATPQKLALPSECGTRKAISGLVA